MITVRIQDHESFDKALKRFKKTCAQTGLLKTLRESSHYTKPSERKKAERQRAIRRQKLLNDDNY